MFLSITVLSALCHACFMWTPGIVAAACATANGDPNHVQVFTPHYFYGPKEWKTMNCFIVWARGHLLNFIKSCSFIVRNCSLSRHFFCFILCYERPLTLTEIGLHGLSQIEMFFF
jgi:hypothetical protein